MATQYNPKIVTDGLVLCLDAANRRSYPGSGTAWSDLSGNNRNASLVNGSFHSLKVYNRALSADEILQNYNAVRSRFGV